MRSATRNRGRSFSTRPRQPEPSLPDELEHAESFAPHDTDADAPISCRTRNASTRRRGPTTLTTPSPVARRGRSTATTTAAAAATTTPPISRGRGRGRSRNRIQPFAVRDTTPVSWTTATSPTASDSSASTHRTRSQDGTVSTRGSQEGRQEGCREEASSSHGSHEGSKGSYGSQEEEDEGTPSSNGSQEGVGDELPSSHGYNEEKDSLYGDQEDRGTSSSPGFDEGSNTSHGRFKGGDGRGGGTTGRRFRPFCCLKLLALATLLLIPWAAVVFHVYLSTTVVPPCHVQNNPNLLVPCALAVDLNRALTAIPLHVSPAHSDVLFPWEHKSPRYRRLHFPSLATEAAMEELHWTYVLPGPHTRDVDGHGVFLDTQAFYPPIRDSIWSRANRANRSILPSHLESVYMMVLRLLQDDPSQKQVSEPSAAEEMAALRAAAEELFSKVYRYASSRDSARQNQIDHARILLQYRIKQQGDVHHEVQWLSASQVPPADLLSRLVLRRNFLLRLLFSEATLTCWLEEQNFLEAAQRALSQQIWKEGQEYLYEVRKTKDPQRLAGIIHRQNQKWRMDVRAMQYRVDGQPNAKVQRSCAAKWAESKIGYCVSAHGARTNNAKTSPRPWSYWSQDERWTMLDPAGSGCISHPNRTLWEWHNAIPMDLDAESTNVYAALGDDDDRGPLTNSPSPSFLTPSRYARHWMHRIYTQADLAKYVDVERGAKGITIPFGEDFALSIGPLRFPDVLAAEGEAWEGEANLLGVYHWSRIQIRGFGKGKQAWDPNDYQF